MKKKPQKDLLPKEAFEQHYQMNPKKNTDSVLGAVFNPMQAKDRMKTYNKVNETDH